MEILSREAAGCEDVPEEKTVLETAPELLEDCAEPHDGLSYR
jgi:hypothetical protein